MDPAFRYILSIDIGITHLALVLIECSKEFVFHDVVWFELVDITQFQHLDNEAKQKCTLHHTKTIADWLSHLMYLNTELFNCAEYILIERQPPQGHVAVEQLLFFQYRSKAVLISPRSVHKFFGWSSEIDYDRRKEKSIKILKYRLEHSSRPWLNKEFVALERQHDVSDAFIQALFFLHTQHQEWRRCRQPMSFPDLEHYKFSIF